MRVQAMKDKNRQVNAKDVKVSESLKEYIELLNFEEEREAIVLVIWGKGGWGMHFLGDLNDRPIGRDEMKEALGDLKVGKAPGLDGIVPELLKCRGK